MPVSKTYHIHTLDHFILYGIACGILWWMIEVFINVSILHNGTFIEQLFYPSFHNLWIRFSVACLSISFGIYVHLSLTKRNEMEEKLYRAEKEVDKRVRERTEELIFVNKSLQQEINRQKHHITIESAQNKQGIGVLEESESQSKRVLDSLPFGVVLIDRETHLIVYVNPASIKIISTDRKKIIGSLCYKHICPREEAQCPITDLGESIESSECFLQKANGERVAILKTVLPIRLNNHDYLLESFLDITESMQTKTTPDSVKSGVAEINWEELEILDTLPVS
ncbi:MAG: PAS domain-containing protein [bacterium]